MVLVIDNYDSFTWNLIDYIEQVGEETLVVRNNEMPLEQMLALGFDSLLIGPGPGKPKNAGVSMAILDALIGVKPILGICLGHQAIGEHFAWPLIKAQKPMHGKVSQIAFSSHPLFEGINEPLRVMRYHSLILEEQKNSLLKIIASTEEGEVMGIAHKELPIAGLQFHPESILTETGLLLLQNWFNYIR